MPYGFKIGFLAFTILVEQTGSFYISWKDLSIDIHSVMWCTGKHEEYYRKMISKPIIESNLK